MNPARMSDDLLTRRHSPPASDIRCAASRLGVRRWSPASEMLFPPRPPMEAQAGCPATFLPPLTSRRAQPRRLPVPPQPVGCRAAHVPRIVRFPPRPLPFRPFPWHAPILLRGPHDHPRSRKLMTLTQDRRAALMGGCPLLGLRLGAGRRTLSAERVIARQGEIGTGLLIVEGMVRVTRNGTTVAARGPASSSEKLSLLDGGPRVAPGHRRGADPLPHPCVVGLRARAAPGRRIALSVLKVVAGRLREVTADHRT